MASGRVGRMIMFRECLLRNYKTDKMFLIDTIKHEQDIYEKDINEC